MILVALKPGQLGNQLWLFSHFIAFSRENGNTIVNPAFDDYASRFEGSRNQLVASYPPRNGRGLLGSRLSLYSSARLLGAATARADRHGALIPTVRLPFPGDFRMEDTFDLRDRHFRALAQTRRLIIVKGWQFVNGESLAAHRSILRRYFRPLPADRVRVEEFLRSARSGVDLLVGVHIRQGDTRSFLGGRYYFDLGIYRRMIDETRECLSPRHVRFVVCSDENIQANRLGRDVVRGPGDLIGDMYTLAGCDYLLAPPSTYSMWASFYGEVPLWTVTSVDDHVDLTKCVIRESQFPFGKATLDGHESV